MVNIVLAAGYATRMYPLTENFPKPLLEIGGVTILDRMLADIDAVEDISRHIIVTNHKFAGHFEKWDADAAEQRKYRKPVTIVDDGSTCNDNRLGAVCDLILALRQCDVADDVFVAAADNVLDFSLAGFVDYFKDKGTAVIMCMRETDPEALRRSGVIELDGAMKVISMEEKPQTPKGTHVTPPFYIYPKSDLPYILGAIEGGCRYDAPGNLARYISDVSELHAYEMPGRRYDIGSIEGYEAMKDKSL